MKIELVILPEAGPTPEAPQTFALGLTLAHPEGAITPSHTVLLQRGFSTAAHCLSALVECLTFAPPDMTAIEEGLTAISGLLDRVRDIEEAITLIGGRLNTAEEMLEQMAVPAGQQGNRLLPPRPGATAAAVAASRQPAKAAVPQPSIRRAPQQTMVTAGHMAGGSKGNAGLVITGGVGRPGMLNPTGPGAEGVDTEGEGE